MSGRSHGNIVLDDGNDYQSFHQARNDYHKPSLTEEKQALEKKVRNLEEDVARLEKTQLGSKTGLSTVMYQDMETRLETANKQNALLKKYNAEYEVAHKALKETNDKYERVHREFNDKNVGLGQMNRKLVLQLESFHRREKQLQSEIDYLRGARDNSASMDVHGSKNIENAPRLAEGERDKDAMEISAEPHEFNDPVQPMKKWKKKEPPGEKQRDDIRKMSREELEAELFQSLCDRVTLVNDKTTLKRSKDSADKSIREHKWNLSRCEKEVANAKADKDMALTNLHAAEEELATCQTRLAESQAEVEELTNYKARATAERAQLIQRKEELKKQQAASLDEFNTRLKRMHDAQAADAVTKAASSKQIEELRRKLADAQQTSIHLEIVVSKHAEDANKTALRNQRLKLALATANQQLSEAQTRILELQAAINANPLTDEVQTLRSETELLTQRLRSYEKEAQEYVQNQQTERHMIQQQMSENVAQANSRIADLESRLTTCVSIEVFNNLQAEKQKLEESLQTQTETSKSIQLDLSRKDEEMYQQLDHMREQHEKEGQVLSSELEMYKERVSTLSGSNDDTAQLEKEYQERQQLSEENKKLSSNLEIQARRLEELSQQNANYSNEIMRLSSDIESIREENSGLSAEKKSLSSNLKIQAQRLEELSQQNAQYSDEIMRLSSNIERTREENSGLSAEKKSLSSNLKIQAQRLEELSQQNAQYSDEIMRLSSNIERIREENSGLSAEKKSLSSNLETQAHQLDELNQKNAQYSDDIIELSFSVDSLREENSGLSADKLRLSAEVKAQAQQLEKMVQEKAKCFDEVKLLSASSGLTREENSGLSAAKPDVQVGFMAQAEQLGQVLQEKERIMKENTDLSTAVATQRGRYDKLIKEMQEMQYLLDNSKEDLRQKQDAHLAEITQKESERQIAVEKLSEAEARHTIVENNLRTSFLSEKEDLENTIDMLQAEIVEKEKLIREIETSRHEAIQRANAADMTATELRAQLSSLEDTLEGMSAMELSLQKEARRLTEKCDSLQAELELERQYTESLQPSLSSEPANISQQAANDQERQTMESLELANRNVEQTFRMLDVIQPLANLLDDDEDSGNTDDDEPAGEDNDIEHVDDRGHMISPELSDESDNRGEHGTRPGTPAGTQASFTDKGTTMSMSMASDTYVTDLDTIRHFLAQGEGNDAVILHSSGDVALLEQFRQIKTEDISNETVVEFMEFTQRQLPLVLSLTEFSQAIGRYEGSAALEVEGSENDSGSGKRDQSVQTDERYGTDQSMQTENCLRDDKSVQTNHNPGNDQSVQTVNNCGNDRSVQTELVKDVHSVHTDRAVEVEKTINGEVGFILRQSQISYSLWDKPLWHWQWVLLLISTFVFSVITGGNTAGFAWCILAAMLCLHRWLVDASGLHIGIKWVAGVSMSVLWILPLGIAIYNTQSGAAVQSRTHDRPFFPELFEAFQWGIIIEPLIDQVSELSMLILGDAHPPLY